MNCYYEITITLMCKWAIPFQDATLSTYQDDLDVDMYNR